MPGLEPGIHAVTSQQVETPLEWIAGPSPAEAMAGGPDHKASARVGGSSPAMTWNAWRYLASPLAAAAIST